MGSDFAKPEKAKYLILDVTEIGVGRKVRGEVAFDGADSAYYEYIFEDIFITGQAIWKFELAE